jgi:hypothetical protein
MRRTLINFLLLVLASCSSSPVPKGILTPDKMQQVMYDLIRIDEFINGFVIKDTLVDIKKKRSELYEEAFKVNKTTRKEFFLSYKYYQQHPDIQKGLYDSLYESINRKKVPMEKSKELTKPVK